jgi:ribosomal protein S15P/S13E
MFEGFIRETIKEQMDKAKEEIVEEIVKKLEDIFDPCNALEYECGSGYLVNNFRSSIKYFIRNEITEDIRLAVSNKIKDIDAHIKEELKDVNSVEFLNNIVQRINKMQLKGE